MLERDIERAVCKYAESRGMLQYKFTSPARNSVPDRLLITPVGVVWFIEFKAPGKKATPQQEREHRRLEAQGVKVFVVDDVMMGKMVIDGMLL